MGMAGSLIGLWLYTSVFYRGNEMPLPNPNLQLQIVFLSSEEMKLRYSYSDSSGFCESTSEYKWDDANHKLHVQVKSVDSENADFCHGDPDMQVGHESETPIFFKDRRLHLQLNLGEEDIIMILERQSSE